MHVACAKGSLLVFEKHTLRGTAATVLGSRH